MTPDGIVRQAYEAQLRLVRFLYCDNGGIIRCKATHVAGFARRLHEGIGQSVAVQAWTGTEERAEVQGMGAVGEFRLVPDPATFTIAPYVPRTGTILCDMMRLDGEPWEACPRDYLKRMIARARKHGIELQASIEHEFYLAREHQGIYIPADKSPLYSTFGLNSHAQLIDTLLASLETQGIPVEQYHTELGPGQQELSIAHSAALTAADRACIVRETIRGIVQAHGLVASFAPKPFHDQGGSGAHIHFSLWESDREKRNLLHAAGQPGALSQLGAYFVGGILFHLSALMALTCGSPNSYARIQQGSNTSAYTAYGFDNRECAIRIASPFWGREASSINLELRCADHSGNPYLVLGALIAAGLDGLERRIDPGAAQNIDPADYSDDERKQLNIRRLPLSLVEALDELEGDALLRETLGSTLSDSYIRVKRKECAKIAGKSPQEIATLYFSCY